MAVLCAQSEPDVKVEEACTKSDCKADDLGNQLEKLTVEDAVAVNGNHEAHEAQELQPCEAVVEEVKHQLTTCHEGALLDVEVVQEPSSTPEVCRGTAGVFCCW